LSRPEYFLPTEKASQEQGNSLYFQSSVKESSFFRLIQREREKKAFPQTPQEGRGAVTPDSFSIQKLHREKEKTARIKAGVPGPHFSQRKGGSSKEKRQCILKGLSSEELGGGNREVVLEPPGRESIRQGVHV